MIPQEELIEYRAVYGARKAKAEYMRAYINDPAHPERKRKNRARAHGHYHVVVRKKRPSEVYYDPLARKIKLMNDRARRRTPEFRARRNAKNAEKRRALWMDAISKGDLSSVRKRMWTAAKRRSAQFGLPFTITPDDITIPATCPILGVVLRFDRSTVSPDSPSLDQILPRRGYTKENIVVVSRRANTLKNDATLEEMEKMLAFYRPLLKK